MALQLHGIFCPNNYPAAHVAPKKGDIIQLEDLPVDTIATEDETGTLIFSTECSGYGIAIIHNGLFSGWIERDDKKNVADHMFAYKWTVTYMREWFFRRGGGLSRKIEISPTKIPSDAEGKFRGVHKNLTAEEVQKILGVVKVEKLEEGNDGIVKQEEVQDRDRENRMPALSKKSRTPKSRPGQPPEEEAHERREVLVKQEEDGARLDGARNYPSKENIEEKHVPIKQEEAAESDGGREQEEIVEPGGGQTHQREDNRKRRGTPTRDEQKEEEEEGVEESPTKRRRLAKLLENTGI